ncbi:RNA polymerase sigma factor [Streptomyces phaeochromogenes]|uniref:RNA polymerase sigma factor n=1 Tax=Streptomyces phaeochromogenes TaxID=1923 RepID=UPI0033DC3D75
MTGVPPDAEALFDELFRAWYRRLLAQALMVSGGPRALADDAVQEAFLLCWERMHATHLEPVRNWPAWLRTTTVHEVLRLKRKAEPVGFDPEAHDKPSADLDLLSHIVVRGTYRRVCERIATLSTMQREIMGRCAIAGQSLGDAAMEMGIQVSTARAHLYRARQALKGVRAELLELGAIDPREGRER